MIVCHCMNISEDEIRRAVDWMRASDNETLITPGKIYRALGKKADCGGCLPLFMDVMQSCESLEVPTNLRNLKRIPNSGERHEGRR
ncbi:MAG: bacterioferritin-associated ferredoxin [Paracoccaceae bacterium]